MNLITLSLLLFVFITSAAAKPTRETKYAEPAEPARPVIPNTFQVEVEAIFKDKKVGADGTLYFDQPNNIAVIDLLWQDDIVKKIYSFDTNEIISIKGLDCDVINMEDDPRLSFFPFNVDPKSKRKLLASPEEALYFQNSKYVKDTYDDEMESYMYHGYYDVLMYKKKNCSITHRFSKTDFETPTCDSDYCKPVLLTMSVSCEVKQGNDIDHLYKFFHFIDTIEDDSVFHAPSGVYCDRKGIKSFPSLPMYFSFSYDINIQNMAGFQSFHKKVWYDGDMELLRVDGFERDGLVHDVHVYDFFNGMTYLAIPQLEQSDRGELPEGLSLDMVTLLPREIFPRTIQQPVASPTYAGVRKVHGLEYSVWSTVTEGAFRTVTEMYFLKTMSEVDGEVQETGFQLSYLEIYVYSKDQKTDNLKLSEKKFIPVNNFRSISREWPMFDVSSWFDSNEKRSFEISATGPKIIPESKAYNDFLEQLYLEVITVGTISLTRISNLEMMTPSESDSTNNSTTFRGMILENLNKLGYDKQQNNESDLGTAFEQLDEQVNGGHIGFSFSDNTLEPQSYVLHSFREIKTEKKNEKKKNVYSGGTVAGVAWTMFIVGVIGTVVIYILCKKKKAKIQTEQLLPADSTKLTTFNDKQDGHKVS